MKSDPEVEAQPDREDNEDESEDSSEEEVVASTEIASLAKAAASGCRKCKNELKTGEKTRKGHGYLSAKVAKCRMQPQDTVEETCTHSYERGERRRE